MYRGSNENSTEGEHRDNLSAVYLQGDPNRLQTKTDLTWHDSPSCGQLVDGGKLMV